MEVWLLHWEYPYDMESNITVWTSEQDALKQACSEIEDSITNDWDMDDEHQSQVAEEISDLQKRGKLREAMDAWNDYQSNYNDEYAQYYSVMKKAVQSHDASDVVTSAPPVAYRASTSGATCRGPCKQYNEYAYADRPDGTHLCRQCSTFQHIFGVTK